MLLSEVIYISVNMSRPKRKSLWGLQWVFLKEETPVITSKNTLNSLVKDLEEEPLPDNLEDLYDIPLSANSSQNYKTDFIEKEIRIPSIVDLRSMKYRSPNIELEKPKVNLRRQLKKDPVSKKSSSRSTASSSYTRRINYGKWYLPPIEWQSTLHNYLKTCRVRRKKD